MQARVQINSADFGAAIYLQCQRAEIAGEGAKPF